MSDKYTSRRRFLKMGCATMAAGGLTICGVSAVVPDPPPIDLSSFAYGEKSMSDRVLVAYASATGSTMEVAAAIGETLGGRGLYVDVKPIQENPPLDGYRAVLLGSAVQNGQWLPGAIEFVRANQAALGRMPVALFSVHIQNRGNDATSRQKRLAYLDAVRPLVRPIDEAFFDGRFDRRGAALLLPRLVARLVPTMDYRDWKKIRAWAEGISPGLFQLA